MSPPTTLFIYIAGPVTKGDHNQNIRNALAAAEALHGLNKRITCFVPHLFSTWDYAFPKDYDTWMEMCRRWLTRCDALYRIPGESRGADQEVKWATEAGQRVFHGLADVDLWIDEVDAGLVLPSCDCWFRRFEKEQAAWSLKNFPHTYPEGTIPYRPLLGALEELGELAHAHLKQEQQIRGTAEEHEAAARDSLGDILIYLNDYAQLRGWSLLDCLKDAWEEVGKRDWTKNKVDGTVDEEDNFSLVHFEQLSYAERELLRKIEALTGRPVTVSYGGSNAYKVAYEYRGREGWSARTMVKEDGMFTNRLLHLLRDVLQSATMDHMRSLEKEGT